MDGPTAYITAREAVALLDVRLPTLYAYVTRGLVHSVPGPTRRGRLYLRADLDRLKLRHDARAGHAAVAADALRWGEPVLDSAVTRIDRHGPAYRGQLAHVLARADVPFESVAELLWRDAPLAERPPWRANGLGFRPSRLAAVLGKKGMDGRVSVFRRLLLALPMLAEGDDAARSRATTHDECDRARTLLARLCAALCVGDDARCAAALAATSMARAMALALGARGGPSAEQAINRALVVSADHELNASTFAARVAASAGCDLYACVCAALAVLSGDRHGGVTAAVEAVLAKIDSPSGARALVEERNRQGDTLPGFGHRLYPDGDPRAEVLLELARTQARRNARVAVLLALVDAMKESGRETPTLDLGLVAVAQTLRLPSGSAGALFAIGRTAGWIAHVLEQREARYVLRPRARYVGRP